MRIQNLIAKSEELIQWLDQRINGLGRLIAGEPDFFINFDMKYRMGAGQVISPDIRYP